MKLLFDYFPIILFFVAFKTYDIYVATAVAMVASVVQVAYYYARHRRVENMHLISMGVILVFGGMTLVFHDDTFIKWKPTIVNWLFAVAFLAAALFSEKNLLERMMASTLKAPKHIWARINLYWVLFFVFSGLLNIYVAFYYGLDLPEEERTAIWVNFKLFGMLGITLVFILIQSLYLARFASAVEQNPNEEAKS